MKSQLVKRISKKYLLPNLHDFNIRGHLIYHQDINNLLRGFCFESSAFSSTSFTIEVLIQPLFIPNGYLVFTFGNRLGFLAKRKDIWWEYDEEHENEISQEILSMMVNYGLPFLEERESIEKFIEKYKNINAKENQNIVEAVSYAYILIGDYEKSKSLLKSLDKILTQNILNYPEIGWIKDIRIRVQLILRFLDSDDYESLKRQLNDWKSYTLSNLGLITA